MNIAWSGCAIALVVLVCGALYGYTLVGHRVREVEPLPEPKVDVGVKVEPLPEPNVDAGVKGEPVPEPKVDLGVKVEPVPESKVDVGVKGEPVPEPKVTVEAKVEPLHSKINKDIDPVYWTLRFMLPSNQRQPKGLVMRLIKYSVNMIPASMTFWLLRMRERLARGTIDSTEAESMADGKSVEDLWFEGRKEDNTRNRKRSAAACVHLSPSCMSAMRALDRSRPARRQRWSPEPAVPFTDVVVRPVTLAANP